MYCMLHEGLKDRRYVRESMEQAGDKFGGQWVTVQHCPHAGKFRRHCPDWAGKAKRAQRSCQEGPLRGYAECSARRWN